MGAGATRLFASTDLARRIDEAEARLTAELGAIGCARKPDLAFVVSIGGGVAVFAGPASPANKMIGVGFDDLPADDALAEVERRFAARGAPLQAEVSTLAQPELAARLTRRGYVLQGVENVLGRPITADDGRPEDVLPAPFALVETSTDEFDAWLDVAVEGFGQPDLQGVPAEALPERDTLREVLREFASATSFRRYAARVGDRFVGCASLRLDSGLAQLCGAATLPAYRRRGIQTALVRQRLADAYDAHGEVALVTTQPGSRSQQNAQRQGFELLYSRLLLVKPPR